MTENKDWQIFFASLRSSFKLPSRHDLSNKLLDECYRETKSEVTTKINKASSLAIQADTWSNIRNEGIFNVIVNTPEPVFLKSIPTTDQSQTGEFYASLVSEVINNIGADKVFGVCTNNASNCQAAWSIIETNFEQEQIYCYGCVCHILDLFVHDLMTLKTIEILLEQIKDIVKRIKKSHLLKAKFTEIQNKEAADRRKICSLKIPAKTRWNSVIKCLESFKINQSFLKQLAISDAVRILNTNPQGREKNTATRKFSVVEIDPTNRSKLILEDDFWVKIDKLILLLKPLKVWLDIFQRNSALISSVPEGFIEIEGAFRAQLENSPLCLLTEEEKIAIFEHLEKRKAMAVRPIHLAANILDPVFKGRRLQENEVISGRELIQKLSGKFG